MELWSAAGCDVWKDGHVRRGYRESAVSLLENGGERRAPGEEVGEVGLGPVGHVGVDDGSNT